MSNFTVDWEPAAEIDLARLWLNAPDPLAVTRAQAEIDRLLERDPVGNGRHLSEGLYRLHVPPLAVTYTIDTEQKLVKVVQAYYAP